MINPKAAIWFAIALLIAFQVAIPMIAQAINGLNYTVFGISLQTLGSLVLLGVVLGYVFVVLPGR